MKIKALSIITWEFFQQIAEKYLEINFLSLDKYINYLSGKGVSVNWYRLEKWGNLEDGEIYEKIESLKLPVGQLYVITEVCYKNNLGPFELDASALGGFVSKHIDKFGECYIFI